MDGWMLENTEHYNMLILVSLFLHLLALHMIQSFIQHYSPLAISLNYMELSITENS